MLLKINTIKKYSLPASFCIERGKLCDFSERGSSERLGQEMGALRYMGFEGMYDPKGVHGFVDVLSEGGYRFWSFRDSGYIFGRKDPGFP